jgi:hypothetical protein
MAEQENESPKHGVFILRKCLVRALRGSLTFQMEEAKNDKEAVAQFLDAVLGKSQKGKFKTRRGGVTPMLRGEFCSFADTVAACSDNVDILPIVKESALVDIAKLATKEGDKVRNYSLAALDLRGIVISFVRAPDLGMRLKDAKSKDESMTINNVTVNDPVADNSTFFEDKTMEGEGKDFVGGYRILSIHVLVSFKRIGEDDHNMLIEDEDGLPSIGQVAVIIAIANAVDFSSRVYSHLFPGKSFPGNLT